MTATEQQVRMAAQLYDMRDKAKRLLGERYKPHMAELGKILKATADRDHARQHDARRHHDGDA